MSSVEEIEFADIQNMEYPLTRNENKNICNSYSYEPYSLTMVFGAVCLDGIVLIADRKLTNTIGGKDDAGIKIHGDLEHILMGYRGSVKMFDIFRKYVVGDVIITRADEERYKYDNVLDTMSTLVKELSLLINKSAT